MRQRLFLVPLLFCLIAISGCQDKTFKTYTANVPTYISYEAFRTMEPVLSSSQDVKNPGKIYIKGQYLFINERYEGVHVFDNTDPSNPHSLGFIAIHANMDMAMKNDILYVDNYTDLLAIDLSDPMNPELVSRTEDVFNFTNGGAIPGIDANFPIAEFNPAFGVITGWTLQEVTTETYPNSFFIQEDWFLIDTFESTAMTSDPTFGSAGIGGSMARFTIALDHLYTLQDHELSAFDISNDASPSHQNDVQINRLAETIFPHGEHLFIGTTSGMIIYSITNPSLPNFVSEYEHWVSCDPVFVSDNKAYVTLSQGSCTWNPVNELQVIDISNISNPQLMAQYEMTDPKGLSIDGQTLFLCDGTDGLKVFNIADSYAIDDHMISSFPNIDSWDVIAYNNILLMIGQDGLYQYSYNDLNNITLLSIIPTH
jgi:hypothetical protein